MYSVITRKILLFSLSPRFYPLPFPAAPQPSARAVSTQFLNERMKEMSERIEAMDQITQNMDREFKSSRVVRFIITHSSNCEEAGLSNRNSNESIDFQSLAKSFFKFSIKFCEFGSRDPFLNWNTENGYVLYPHPTQKWFGFREKKKLSNFFIE